MFRLTRHAAPMCTVVLGIVLLATQAEARWSTPNVILITADDYGADAAALYTASSDLGPTTPTPNLESLASRGIVFENAMAMPACSPTRGTISTGNLPSTSGIGGVVGPSTNPGTPTELDPRDPTLLSARLKAAGYTTALLGKWHQTSGPSSRTDPNTAGFDLFFGQVGGAPIGGDGYVNWIAIRNGRPDANNPIEDFISEALVDEAIGFIQNSMGPYFLWLSFNASHFPYQVAPMEGLDPVIHADVIQEVQNAFVDSFGGAYPPAGTNVVTQAQARAAFKSLIAFMDAQIGRLLAEVDLADTYVFFVSDNGTQGTGGLPTYDVVEPPFDPSRSKATLYRNGVEVPLIVAGPIITRKGIRTRHPVSTVDLYATILRLARIEVPKGSKDSVSFKRVLRSGIGTRRISVAEKFWPTPAAGGNVSSSPGGLAGPTDGRVLSDGRFRLIAQSVVENDQIVCRDPTLTPPDCINSQGDFQKQIRLELYDTRIDPFEDDDLLTHPSSMTPLQRRRFMRLCAKLNRVSRRASFYQTGRVCRPREILTSIP